MAFMVPIIHNDWDPYGTSRQGDRRQQRSTASSRRPSATSCRLSGVPSFGSCRGSTPHQRSPSGGSNLSSGQRSVTFGAPSPPSGGRPAGAAKTTFHAKVVGKLMKVLHRESSRS